MSKIVVKEESSKVVLQEAYNLAKLHYEEVEDKSDKMAFNMDVGAMSNLLDLGLLFIITARVEGELVGYFASILSPDLYNGGLVSNELGIYVRKDMRGSSAFHRMLKEVERVALSKGAYTQMMAFKVGHDDGLAVRCGYQPTETIYHKLLEK